MGRQDNAVFKRRESKSHIPRLLGKKNLIERKTENKGRIIRVMFLRRRRNGI